MNTRSMKKYNAVIFDLDNTIFPTKSITNEVAQPVWDAIRYSNDNYFSDKGINDVFSDCYCMPIREVALKHKFPKKMIDAIEIGFSKMTIDYPLTTYKDYSVLGTITTDKFLVTSGNIHFQNLKINKLNIRNDFKEILIHDDGDPSHLGKIKLFEFILKKYRLNRNEVLVIGDNINSEIRAGNSLGMATIQILREGITKEDGATYYINDFYELLGLP